MPSVGFRASWYLPILIEEEAGIGQLRAQHTLAAL
jgi:hypothetical protein